MFVVILLPSPNNVVAQNLDKFHHFFRIQYRFEGHEIVQCSMTRYCFQYILQQTNGEGKLHTKVQNYHLHQLLEH